MIKLGLFQPDGRKITEVSYDGDPAEVIRKALYSASAWKLTPKIIDRCDEDIQALIMIDERVIDMIPNPTEAELRFHEIIWVI